MNFYPKLNGISWQRIAEIYKKINLKFYQIWTTCVSLRKYDTFKLYNLLDWRRDFLEKKIKKLQYSVLWNNVKKYLQDIEKDKLLTEML